MAAPRQRSDGVRRAAASSIFPQENDAVVDAFVEAEPGAQRRPLADGAPAQWLPAAEHDGFYYALIAKRA
jgi:16S rRNA C967 or C1407 C5-methylase (RsmB/RsmF family)